MPRYRRPMLTPNLDSDSDDSILLSPHYYRYPNQYNYLSDSSDDIPPPKPKFRATPAAPVRPMMRMTINPMTGVPMRVNPMMAGRGMVMHPYVRPGVPAYVGVRVGHPRMGVPMAPGMMPGMVPGVVPSMPPYGMNLGMAPGMVPGIAPGRIPGMSPYGMIPGRVPGAVPGMIPGMPPYSMAQAPYPNAAQAAPRFTNPQPGNSQFGGPQQFPGQQPEVGAQQYSDIDVEEVDESSADQDGDQQQSEIPKQRRHREHR